jgi:ERCC4-type nuclease
MTSSNIKLVIDSRESKLISLFNSFYDVKNSKYLLSYESLDIGDIQIVYNNKIVHIYERKTLADLLASIKDNRYKEQKNRLFEMNKGNEIKINYIIEEFKGYNNINDSSIIGSLCSLTLINDFGMFYTKDVKDTYFLIIEIINRFVKNPDKFLNECKNNQNSESNIIVSKKKSANITRNNMLVILLSQIPGISNKIASTILLYHSTMSDLILKLNEYTEVKDKVNYLSKLKFEDNSRSIGVKTSEKIIEYLF